MFNVNFKSAAVCIENGSSDFGEAAEVFDFPGKYYTLL